MRLALAQLAARPGDAEANARRVRDALAEGAAGGADLVVFPELFLSGYALRGVDDAARTPEQVAALVEGPSALVGFHEPGHNSAAYVEAGALLHVQRKLYLVDYAPFHEDELYAPGDELRAFDTALGRMAVLICNDAWQPVLPFLAVHGGAQVLLVPAASSTAVPEAESIWRELTRFYARVLECFVVFVNQAGSAGGLTFWGGSHVVGPRGEIVAEAPRHGEAIVFADLDLDDVETRRRELPLIGEPRLDLLRSEIARLEGTTAEARL
jgi:N-carbamoylputrescine amidase